MTLSRLPYIITSTIGDLRIYWRYRKWCREKGEKPNNFREFRRELQELFHTIRREWNPQTHAQFEIAVRKLIGDCK
jgi:hypothetical protein